MDMTYSILLGYTVLKGSKTTSTGATQYAGLLIFRAVVDLRNSGISAKSREILPKKREIPRNLPEIFPNTCQQNIFNTYLDYLC